MKNSDEGMGLSVVVYAIVMVGGLALFVLPVMWANGARVYENPGVTALRTPGGPAYANRQAQFPLANLKEEPIVSPAMLAELNASGSKKEKPQRTARSSTSSHRSYAQVQDEQTEQRPQRRGFFSFF
jgi:hypothetical protein